MNTSSSCVSTCWVQFFELKDEIFFIESKLDHFVIFFHLETSFTSLCAKIHLMTKLDFNRWGISMLKFSHGLNKYALSY